MSLFLLMVMLGVANWFATTLVVESEIFRPVRGWVADRHEAAVERAGLRSAAFWTKAQYLVGCHMCTGTWIGLAMALFAPAVVSVPVVGWVLTALVIKGIGHLVLLLVNMGNARIAADKAAATESMSNAMPDLGSILDGLMEREMNTRLRGADHKTHYDRRGEKSFATDQVFRVPPKNDGRPKFEPLDKDFNVPETKF